MASTLAIPTTSYAIPASRNGCPTTDEVRRDTTRAIGVLPDEVEASLLATLTRPRGTDQTCLAAMGQREHELRDLFGQLTAVQALGLGRRLDVNRDDDRLAVAFRRFTVERRRRLREYLADTRRRLASTT
jgi:hypothetical protein